MGACASQLCGKPTQIAPAKGDQEVILAYNDNKARLPGIIEESNATYGSYTEVIKKNALLGNNGSDNSPKIAAVQRSSGSLNGTQANHTSAQPYPSAYNGALPSVDERVPVLILWDWASRKTPDIISVYKADEFCSFLKMELTTEGRLLYKLVVVLEAAEVIELANKDAQYIFNNLVGAATVLVADGEASRAAYFKKELDNFLAAHTRCVNEPRVVFLGADFGLGERVLDSNCELVLIMDRKKNKTPIANDIWNDTRLSNYARIKWTTVHECFKNRRSNMQQPHEVLIESVPGHTVPKRRLPSSAAGQEQLPAASNGNGNAISLVSTVYGTQAANAAAAAAKLEKAAAEREEQSTLAELTALLPMRGSTGNLNLMHSPVSSATPFSNESNILSPTNIVMNDDQSLSANLQALFASASLGDNTHSSKLAATRERIRQNSVPSTLKRLDSPATGGSTSRPTTPPPALYSDPTQDPDEPHFPAADAEHQFSAKPAIPFRKLAPIPEVPAASSGGFGDLKMMSAGSSERKDPRVRGSNNLGPPTGPLLAVPQRPGGKAAPIAESVEEEIGARKVYSTWGRIQTLGRPVELLQPRTKGSAAVAEAVEVMQELSTSCSQFGCEEPSGRSNCVSSNQITQELVLANLSGITMTGSRLSRDLIYDQASGQSASTKYNGSIGLQIPQDTNIIDGVKTSPESPSSCNTRGVRHLQNANTHRNGLKKRCLNRVARALQVPARRPHEEGGQSRLAGLPGWEYPWRGDSSHEGGRTRVAQAVAESVQSGNNATVASAPGQGRAALVLWDIENCHLVEGEGKSQRLAATAAAIRRHLDAQFLSTASPSSLRLVTAVSTQSLHFNRVVCGYRGFVSDLCMSGVDLVLAAARKEHPPSLKAACAALQLAPATIISKASKRDADVILKKELDLFIDQHAASAQTSPKSERPMIVHISSDEDFISSLERAARLGFDLTLLQDNAIDSVLATVRVAGGTCTSWREFRAAAAATANRRT